MAQYRVKGWADHFEVSQTRKVENVRWVPLPVKHDGLSFRRLMSMQDGAAIYGAWVLIVQVAAKCPVRGVLADEHGPLTAEDLSLKTGCSVDVFDKALSVLSSRNISWLECDSTQMESDSTRMESDSSALQLQDKTIEENTGEENTKQKPAETPVVVVEKTTKKVSVRVEDVTIPPELNTPPVVEALSDWLEHHRTKGSPYKSAKAVARLFDPYIRAGPAAFIAAVNHSIGCNYQGLFPPKDQAHGRGPVIGPGQRHDPSAKGIGTF